MKPNHAAGLDSRPRYLSRLIPRSESLRDRRFWHYFHDAYRIHQLVWTLFEGADGRDFLYREDRLPLFGEERAHPILYTLSTRRPQDPHGWFELQTSELRPRLKAGESLRFSLRANPVVSVRTSPDRDDQPSRGRRHDVIMHAIRGQRELPPEQRLPRRELLYREGLNWLEQRGEANGFALDRARCSAEAYTQHRVWPSSMPEKPERPIRFSTIDFEGILTVTDPVRLVSLLMQGVGPARGFGCGLMLVRRS